MHTASPYVLPESGESVIMLRAFPAASTCQMAGCRGGDGVIHGSGHLAVAVDCVAYTVTGERGDNLVARTIEFHEIHSGRDLCVVADRPCTVGAEVCHHLS